MTTGLLEDTIATIEHILPRRPMPGEKAGENNLYNFLIVSKWANNKRGNKPFEQFIEGRKEIFKNNIQTNYIDPIINFINNGRLKNNEYYPYAMKKVIETHVPDIKINVSAMKMDEITAMDNSEIWVKNKLPALLINHQPSLKEKIDSLKNFLRPYRKILTIQTVKESPKTVNNSENFVKMMEPILGELKCPITGQNMASYNTIRYIMQNKENKYTAIQYINAIRYLKNICLKQKERPSNCLTITQQIINQKVF